jgi:hypothetical protein
MSGAPARWQRGVRLRARRLNGQSVRPRLRRRRSRPARRLCRKGGVVPPPALGPSAAHGSRCAARSRARRRPARPPPRAGAPRAPAREASSLAAAALAAKKDAACIAPAHRPNSRLRKIASLSGEPSSFPARNWLTRLRKTPLVTTSGRRAAHSTGKQTSTTTGTGRMTLGRADTRPLTRSG